MEATPAAPSFERARRIADAVLYEGYVLYPYRASSRKNRYRWTFGVVAPRAWSAAGGCEASSARLECLVATGAESAEPGPKVQCRLRFLHVERRAVEAALPDGGFGAVESLTANGQQHITWEEGVERELPFAAALPLLRPVTFTVRVPGSRDERLLFDGAARVGRIVRTQQPLTLTFTAQAMPVGEPPRPSPSPDGARKGEPARPSPSPDGARKGEPPRPSPSPDGARKGERLLKLTLVVENVTPMADVAAPREVAVASSLVSAHLMLAVARGEFVSLLDPPAEASRAAADCHSVGLYPVLAGEPGSRGLLLASPIVLYDHPQIAAESPGDTFDGTEIDELLALSTRSLTDEEKREARATDRRAAEVIDRAERLSDAALLALHGKGGSGRAAGGFAPGSRVRVRLAAPTGPRRTDAQDMFLDGRVGVVEEVREDFDGQTHVAILLEDDPGAELHRWYGRHLHFRPEELEPMEPCP